MVPLSGKKSWNEFSPKVRLQFEPNDDLLLYASWTRGLRSGNFFLRIVTTPATTVAAAAAQLGPVEPETVGRTNFKQLKFDRVPEWTLYLAGSYDFETGGGTVTPRVSYSYRDHFFTDVDNTPELAQKGYGLLDASLTFKSDKNRSLSLFGRNLTKADYIDVAIGSAFGNLAVGGAPRTWGLQFKIDIE
jgi:outer membrane receptor protein involved in Fe transport